MKIPRAAESCLRLTSLCGKRRLVNPKTSRSTEDQRLIPGRNYCGLVGYFECTPAKRRAAVRSV